jgi:hypothetical protein
LQAAAAAAAEMPFRTWEIGANKYAACARVSDRGTLLEVTEDCIKGEQGAGERDWRRIHADAGELAPGSSVMVEVEGAPAGSRFIGVAAKGKDLSEDGDIHEDGDVWLMSDGGYLCAGGKEPRKEAAAGFGGRGDKICLSFDAAAETIRFMRGEELLGEHTGVEGPVKVVASMGRKGNALRLRCADLGANTLVGGPHDPCASTAQPRNRAARSPRSAMEGGQLHFTRKGRDVTLQEGGTVATMTSGEENLNSVALLGDDSPIDHGVHYWEIELAAGKFVKLGVCTSEAGGDVESTNKLLTSKGPGAWSMRCASGDLFGNGKYCSDAAGAFVVGDRMGFLLDLGAGTLLLQERRAARAGAHGGDGTCVPLRRALLQGRQREGLRGVPGHGRFVPLHGGRGQRLRSRRAAPHRHGVRQGDVREPARESGRCRGDHVIRGHCRG